MSHDCAWVLLSSCFTASSLLLSATLANQRTLRIQPASCRQFPRSLSNLSVPASNFSSKGVSAITGESFRTCPSLHAPFWGSCIPNLFVFVATNAMRLQKPCTNSDPSTFRLVGIVYSAACVATLCRLCRNNAYGFHCYLRGTKQERAAERDEQWEAQQNVLKRRRGNLWQDVSSRRPSSLSSGYTIAKQTGSLLA